MLREYFRREYLSIRPSAYDAPDPFLDMFVDQRIDDYLERLGREVDSLKRSREVLQEMAGELSRTAELNEAVRNRLRSGLAEFGESCDRLRKMVARVLLDLDSKNDFRPPEVENMDSAEVVREIAFLISRTGKALDQVEQFFFSAGAVVHFADLQNQNMLIFLYEANRTAREMRRRL